MKKTVLLYATLSLFFVGCIHQSTPAKKARIPSSTNSAQQRVDDQCFVSYTQAAGQCNSSAGDDDAAFDKCLGTVKAELKRCCKVNHGSKVCDADAASSSQQDQEAIDAACFVSYTQAASRCNTSAGNDDVAFEGCLRPVKKGLKTCCKENGGSANCAEDAQ